MSIKMEPSSRCHPKRGAVELTGSNVYRTITSNELVFLCVSHATDKFSPLLLSNQNYDEFADTVKKEFPREKKLVVAKVLNTEENLAALSRLGRYQWYYGVNVYRNGQLIKLEYPYPKLKDILLNELENPIKRFSDSRELENLDKTKHLIVGYFDREDMPEYENFRQVAHNLKKRCQFYIRYGYLFNNETSKNKRPPKQPTIMFRPGNTRHYERETFKGCVMKYDELNLWANKKCMVRELTLENLEEMKEEYVTFLILFYNPYNRNGVKVFHDVVEKTFVNEKDFVNCVTADGVKFAKLLQNVGKNEKHLPLVAYNGQIMSKFYDISNPGKLQEFITYCGRGIDRKSCWNMVSTVRYAFKRKSKTDASLEC